MSTAHNFQLQVPKINSQITLRVETVLARDGEVGEEVGEVWLK